MNIAALIEAAEYLDRREREQEYSDEIFGAFRQSSEHGYASTLPMPDRYSSKNRKDKNRKSQGNRTTHNELEKNRRAHLRNCLERLKDMVPLGADTSRHTTLGLLTKAKRFIKNLEDKDKRSYAQREHLYRKQKKLRRRLDLLNNSFNMYKRRSVSECSTSTTSSTNSSISMPSSISESVDEVGYVSNQSDDDYSSTQSIKSGTSADSGILVSESASRLTISD